MKQILRDRQIAVSHTYSATNNVRYITTCTHLMNDYPKLKVFMDI